AARRGVRARRRPAVGTVLFRHRRCVVRRHADRRRGARRRRQPAESARGARAAARTRAVDVLDSERGPPMTRVVPASLLCAGMTLAPTGAHAAAALQRYALIVGANSGGANRAQLQYAISDAERFARVMVDLGGVDPAN